MLFSKADSGADCLDDEDDIQILCHTDESPLIGKYKWKSKMSPLDYLKVFFCDVLKNTYSTQSDSILVALIVHIILSRALQQQSFIQNTYPDIFSGINQIKE